LQEPDYHAFAVDVKVLITIFRTLGFVENDKCCFRGIESYLVPGQKSKEHNMKRDAIDAVLVEYEDQFYFNINDPEKVRMCLEPASKGAARLARDRAATDAMEASIGDFHPQSLSCAPLDKIQKGVLPRRSSASTQETISILLCPKRRAMVGLSTQMAVCRIAKKK
jgi:hypothetical protein